MPPVPSHARNGTLHECRTGVRGADLSYSDRDPSWEAEDAVIRRNAELFGDLPVPVEIRNEAREPLRYADRFGAPTRPLRDCTDAIEGLRRSAATA